MAEDPRWPRPDIPDVDDLDAGETISPRPRAWRNESPLHALPRIRTKPEAGLPAELDLTTTLGEGGMAIVRAAIQIPLAREVAVKTLKEGAHSEARQQNLLQEAWIMGSLEHPNIIPIHTLGRSDDETPLIVMKRVEGRTWREILREAERPLDWHLDVLLQVCRALEYAHDHGVIHRDVKPENVMIGEFGEVYLLDWGIAVSLRIQGFGRLPLARDSLEIAGTPRYMAPEMTVVGDPVDERTDVYLLGAVLHELVTGGPLHRGANVMHVMLQAYASEPHEYDGGVPAGLAQICARATSREPEARFESAAAFREALEQYAERRTSYDLAAKADALLDKLRTQAESDSNDEGVQAVVRDLFGQCHFGYEHALHVWPENPDAQAGIADARSIMVRWELDSQNPLAASRLLAKLPAPRPQLAERLRELELLQQREEHELTNLRRDRDLNVAAHARFRLGAGVAVFFSVYPFVASALFKSGIVPHPTGVRSVALSFTLLLFVAGLKVFGRAMWDNEINRQIVSVLLVTAISLPVIRTIGVLRGVGVMDVLGFEFALFAVAAGAVAMLTSRLMLLASAAYFVGGILSAILPSYTLEVFGVTNAFVGIVMTVALRPIK